MNDLSASMHDVVFTFTRQTKRLHKYARELSKPDG